ncbi:LysE family transporter [Anaerotignum sp.]|uniref:LysE family transporter n=1 Tax=Anaerotignum sp. TaxID=2039241 RepID=UPI00332B1CD4
MFHWMNFLTYAVITTATPGPNNIMSMSNAGRVGLKKSYPFNLGIWVGFMAVMIICTVLSSVLHAVMPTLKTPMLIAGAAYMLYLAYNTFIRSGDIQEKQVKNGFLSGLLLQFINPKIYIYGMVSMESYILPYFQNNPVKLFAFAILLATIGCFFNLCWAAFGSIFRILFSRYARLTNTIMSFLLVYCAISLFL